MTDGNRPVVKLTLDSKSANQEERKWFNWRQTRPQQLLRKIWMPCKSTRPNGSGIHRRSGFLLHMPRIERRQMFGAEACPNGSVNKTPTKKDGKLICSPPSSNGEGDDGTSRECKPVSDRLDSKWFEFQNNVQVDCNECNANFELRPPMLRGTLDNLLSLTSYVMPKMTMENAVLKCFRPLQRRHIMQRGIRPRVPVLRMRFSPIR